MFYLILIVIVLFSLSFILLNHDDKNLKKVKKLRKLNEMKEVKELDENSYYPTEDMLEECYLVNLDKSKDRLKFAMKQLRPYFDKIHRFPAIRGINKELVAETEKMLSIKKRTDEEAEYMTGGKIGCALSHLSLMKKLLDSDKDFIYIFEDDIQLCNDFSEHFDRFWKRTPKDYDFIFVGNQLTDSREYNINTVEIDILNPKKLKYKSNSKMLGKIIFDGTGNQHEYINFISSQHTFCTHSYIISRSGAEKLLTYVREKGYRPIDIDIIRYLHENKDSKSYAWVKEIDTEDKKKLDLFEERSTGLVYQRGIESTIHEN